MNTWTEAYCHIPYISGVPSVNPHQTDEFPFVEDLITLGGISGYILNSQILPSRSYIIADHLHIDENVSITFPDNTELYINRNDPDAQTNSTGLTTYSNSELTFGNNMFVTTNMPYLDYDRVTLLITGTSFNVGTSNEFRKVSFFI